MKGNPCEITQRSLRFFGYLYYPNFLLQQESIPFRASLSHLRKPPLDALRSRISSILIKNFKQVVAIGELK